MPVGTPLARIRADGEAKPAPCGGSAAGCAGCASRPAPAVERPPVAPAPPPPVAASRAAGVVARRVAGRATARRRTRRRSCDGHRQRPGRGDHLRRCRAPCSARRPRRPERKRASGSISTRCARRSPPPWRGRSGKSRTTISSIRSTSRPASNGWRARTRALPPDNRLLMGALAIKAVALAARRFPAFNGFYRDGEFEPAPAVHVGVAIAIRGGGLAAPALHDADQLALDELMARMRDLVAAHARRPHPQLGDRRSDDHRLEPGRTRRRGALWHHLSAAGGDRRLRQGGGAAVGRRRRHRAALGRHHHALRPIIGSATATPARCSWPRSASCCRSRTSYERHRYSQSGAGRAQQHRAGNRSGDASIRPPICARRSTSTRWTS